VPNTRDNSRRVPDSRGLGQHVNRYWPSFSVPFTLGECASFVSAKLVEAWSGGDCASIKACRGLVEELRRGH
jgi:hypothetical protein